LRHEAQYRLASGLEAGILGVMANSRNQFILSIMSRDRIGIVYEVSTAISELEGDIADLRQSVLRGYFTMILLASFPARVTGEAIRRQLAALYLPGMPSLEIAVKRADEVAVDKGQNGLENAYVLTASGPDRIGFVATVSAFCARHGINILDLSTAVRNGLYTMILLVDLEACPEDVGTVRQALERFGREAGLRVVLQHYDVFRATNEVSIL
jgi:predicted amino acid-binding ACT domain protein